MARPIPSPTSFHNLSFLPLPAAAFFLILAIFSIVSLVSCLCASHRNTKPQRLNQGSKGSSNRNKLVSSPNLNFSSKALWVVKMISWRKEQAEGEEGDYEVYSDGDDDDDAVWKKTIMMGERCRPLDFSGKILYDSQGNLLPGSPNREKNGTLV